MATSSPASASRTDIYAERAAELRREDAAIADAQARSLLVLAGRHRAAGRLAPAVEALRLATAVAPGLAAPWNDLGVLLAQLGDLSGAITSYRTASRLAPADAALRTNLALALIGASAHAQAADELEVAIHVDESASCAHLLRCLCLLETGRDSEAIAGIDRATRQDPVVRELLAARATVLARADRAAQGQILGGALEALRERATRSGKSSPLAPVALGPELDAAVEEREWRGMAGAVREPQRSATGGLAFALHSAELLNHYRHIWRRMPRGSFDIVAAAESAIENTRIAAVGQALGHRVRFVGDLVAGREAYDIVVSNHLGGAGMDQGGTPVLTAIGRHHVRMLYALGKSRWNFGDWNEMYDEILCWGPYQAAGLSRLRQPRLVQVGYPRLDPLFWPVESRATAVAGLGGDPDRRTIVWLPTWAELSSIDAWAGAVADLQADFNVFVKPHPLTQSSDPSRMRRLADAGLASVSDPLLDNVRLLRAADVVLADYGGSPFGAIYADRDLVLLNVHDAASHPLLGADSIDLAVRQWTFNVSPDEPELLAAYLADTSLQQDQRTLRERLRREIFAPYEGVASEIAALAITAAAARSAGPASASGLELGMSAA